MAIKWRIGKERRETFPASSPRGESGDNPFRILSSKAALDQGLFLKKPMKSQRQCHMPTNHPWSIWQMAHRQINLWGRGTWAILVNSSVTTRGMSPYVSTLPGSEQTISHDMHIYIYKLWSYYLVQVWPFQGLVSGPSLFAYVYSGFKWFLYTHLSICVCFLPNYLSSF